MSTFAVLVKEQILPWQPLLATIVALFAAVLTYQSAMAKTQFDRDQAYQAIARKKLALFARLQFGLWLTEFQIGEILEKIPSKDAPSLFQGAIHLKELELTYPPELDEAWSSLDYFPFAGMQVIQMMQHDRKLFPVLSKDAPQSGGWMIGSSGDVPDILQTYREECAKALMRIKDLNRVLTLEQGIMRKNRAFI